MNVYLDFEEVRRTEAFDAYAEDLGTGFFSGSFDAWSVFYFKPVSINPVHGEMFDDDIPF